MFNPYELYARDAWNKKSESDNKIVNDIRALRTCSDMDEIQNFIRENFGEFEGQKVFDYPDNMIVIVEREKDSVSMGVIKDNKQLVGYLWEYEK